MATQADDWATVLAEADEFTRRRCLAAWAALEAGPVAAVR